MSLLIFIVSGLLLFVFFRLLCLMSRSLPGKKSLKTGMGRILPLLELGVWVTYAFWGALVLFGNMVYYDLITGVMAVLLIFGISWFVFRDFLAGVLLRTEKSLKPGQHIKTPFASGRIQRLGGRSLMVINESGEEIRIPYSSLSNVLLSIPPEDEDSLPHHLRMELSRDIHPGQVRRAAFEHMMSLPWIIEPAPELQLTRDQGGGFVFEATFHTHSGTQAMMVEDKIREFLGKWRPAPGEQESLRRPGQP